MRIAMASQLAGIWLGNGDEPLKDDCRTLSYQTACSPAAQNSKNAHGLRASLALYYAIAEQGSKLRLNMLKLKVALLLQVLVAVVAAEIAARRVSQ